MEIEPYLEEYFFDNSEKLDEFIWDKIQDKLRD
jgi:5-methylcytosine-specific restriction protein B